MMDFHKAAADLQGGEVFPPDGTQSKQCHHKPIANLTCSGELGHFSRVFGLVYQGQADIDENPTQDHAVELRAWPRHQGEVLGELGEPDEVATWGNELCGTPQRADRAMESRRGHSVLQFNQVGVHIFRRHIGRRRSISSEQTAAVEKTQEITIVRGVIVTRDRLEMTGGTSTLKSRSRLTSCDPALRSASGHKSSGSERGLR